MKKNSTFVFWLSSVQKIVDFYMKAIFWSKYIYKFHFYFWRIVFQFLIVSWMNPMEIQKVIRQFLCKWLSCMTKLLCDFSKFITSSKLDSYSLGDDFFFLGRKFSIFSQICVVCVFRVWLGPNSPVLFKTFLFFHWIQWKLAKL